MRSLWLHFERVAWCYFVGLCALVLLASHAWSGNHWSEGLSSRQRFVAFPHVDAGYRAIAQKRFDVAIKEFERALQLSPNNPILVEHLAEAHAASGDLDKAIAVIDSQLEKVPGNTYLTAAKQNYERQAQNVVFQEAQSLRNRPAQLREYVRTHEPVIMSAFAEDTWLGLLAAASTLSDDLLEDYQPQFPQNVAVKRNLLLFMLLREGGYAQADALIDQWPNSELRDARAIDGLSYELLTRGNPDQSLRLLIKAYPFDGATAAQRGQLMTRMVIADSRSRNKQLMANFLDQQKASISSSLQERDWLTLASATFGQSLSAFVNYVVRYPSNESLLEAEIQSRIEAGAPLPSGVSWERVMSQVGPSSEALMDTLTFRLVENGSYSSAWALLIERYPFADQPAAQREKLLERMALIAGKEPSLITASERKRLSTPLDTAELRRLQASIVDQADFKLVEDGAYASAWALLVERYPFDDQPLAQRELLLGRMALIASKEPSLITPAERKRLSTPLETAELRRLQASILDQAEFRLLEEGAYSSAWALLIERYPFDDQPLAQRELLLGRMALIAQREPSLITQSALKRLSIPLDSVALRRLQASILERSGDCVGLRQVLGDMSAAYTWIEWVLLGDCYQKQQRSGLAQYAFERALQLNPTPANQRAVAYAAYQNKDNERAVKAWRAVLQAGDLSPTDWFAATITALAAGDIDLARQWLQGYEAAQGEANAGYWALKARILSVDDLPGAIDAMRRSVEMEPVVGHYVEMAQWQDKLGDLQGSIATLERAVALQPKDGVAQADLGFRYFRADEMRAARGAMQAALKLRPNDVAVTEQLAYIDQRLGENTESKRYIKLSVDHLLRYPSDELTAQEQDRLFSLRRMHEDLSRRWTLSLDALVGNSPAASVQSPVPGQNFKSYSQIEFDYRLGDPAINNGKTLSAYARVFGGSGAQNSALPIYAPVLGVGLRWKPFSEQVIYFAVEQQVPLDRGTSAPANTMLRVSGSFFNTGEYSDDWHPVGPGWFTQNLYLDGAYYLRNQAYALTADYRFGYHHKVAQGQTIQPYVRALTNKVSNETTPDIRVGAGVRWNIWANQSRYSAYSTRYYLGLEVQGAIKTYQSDRVSVFITLGARW